MSWRRDLRPASFRGVPFEVWQRGERGGQRGAHHVYPLRDEGWVEQLGLDDERFTLEAFVIGDDYMARRDALRDALKEPGAGELIDPWLGSLEVVVDPSAGWSISETSRRGRMARFSLTFLRAPADGTLPSDEIDGQRATEDTADVTENVAIEIFGRRIDLDRAEAAIDDMQQAFDDAFAELDDARAVVSRVTQLQRRAVGTIVGAVAKGQTIAREVLAVGDAANAVAALFDAVAGGIGGRTRRPSNPGTPGDRPAAQPPDAFERTAEEAETAAAAIRVLLERDPAQGDGTIGTRFTENRAAFDGAFDAILLSELCRALVQREYDSHQAAIAAMKEMEASVEIAIRREADRQTPDDLHVRQLTDLRRVARDALLAAAADIVPIAIIELPESLPSLALAWRVGGRIDQETDLITRNAIVHPLWSPPQIQLRERANG
ncbi:MAG: DNA circularization N-terminal domain-containing protein [Pseudomonadota bacterium]